MVRAALDAVFRGDAEAFVSSCTEDVVWEENTPVFPGMKPRYEGHDGLRDWFREAVAEAWSDLVVERSDLGVVDGQVVLDMSFLAHGRVSGVETKLRIWQVFRLDGGRIARRRLFLTETEARRPRGTPEGLYAVANRAADRARRFSASTSRSFGGAFVTSSSRRSEVACATRSTARSNASAFALEGFVEPLILRMYWSAASWTSSRVAGGSKL